MKDLVETTFNDEYPLQKPDPEIIPEPTIWPLALAFGLLFMLWGLITIIVLTFVGVILFGLGLAGWINDLKPDKYER